ncbi:LysR substrate-binding domain-containing protein [Xanthomonas translucens]|uniref:LysR substrate-binding domain-containing protein n=1 Tax=Xanthomonas campestris pv. translucens TaxID=343 RepID=UPI0031F303F6
MRLLHRTTRRVALSEHGARFLQRLTPGLAQIEAAFLDLDTVRERPAGHLRITLPRVVADQLVMPWLPAFLARYPQIEVELCVDPALVDVVAEGFDAGIRLGECRARDMIAVPLGPLQRQVICAAPDYFRRHAPPRTPADLVDHDCIVHRLSNGRRMAWEFSRDGRDFEVEVSGTLVFNDSGLTHAAALAGLGLAQGFESVVAADVAAARARRLAAALRRFPSLLPGARTPGAETARVHRPSTRGERGGGVATASVGVRCRHRSCQRGTGVARMAVATPYAAQPLSLAA